MAATATSVFETSDGTRRVAILRRSSEVVNARGMTLSCTGMGIDLSDGSLTLALLARFPDSAYLDHVRATATGSWESEQASRERPAVEFPDLDDPRLAEMVASGAMEPSSAFSLDLARQYLRARPSIGRSSGVT